MPNDRLLSQHALLRRLGLKGLPMGFTLMSLVACNGNTAFMSQSRLLPSQVRVAGADEDALQQRAKYSKVKTIPEGPRSGVPSDSSDNEGQGEGENPSAEDQSSTTGPSAQIPPSGGSGSVVVPPLPVPEPTSVPRVPASRAGDLVTVQLNQPRAKVDILWVVDSSGSMEWAQNQLRNQFQSFAEKLKDTRIDFQLGVTSADVCQVDSGTGAPLSDALCPDSNYMVSGVQVGKTYVGALRGTLQADPVSKKSILRDSSDFVQAFQRTAMLGTEGAGFEHGLWAAKMAVEKALQLGVNGNTGFIRSDAALSVVVLSDEEDDSVQMWCEDAYGRTSLTSSGSKDLTLCRKDGRSPFLDAFGMAPYAIMKSSNGAPLTTHKFTADQFKAWAESKSVKGAGNFRVSAITGLRNAQGQIDCAGQSHGPKESGTNYIKAAQLTGGAVENICSPQWSSVLKNIGQNTVELATRVSLPAGRIPFAGTLEVKVDGQDLDAMQYSYDATLHAVVFKVPPAMGSEVIVSYRETLVD
jgi:hypothetical protein